MKAPYLKYWQRFAVYKQTTIGAFYNLEVKRLILARNVEKDLIKAVKYIKSLVCLLSKTKSN